MNIRIIGETGWRCKAIWMDVAEVIDTLRLIPRAVLGFYGFWMAEVTNWLVKWYMRLPAAERTAEVTAFVTIVLPGIFGLAIWVYRIYAQGGRQWDNPPTAQGNPVTATTTMTSGAA